MAATKFTDPNWHQKLIVKEIGLDPADVTIRNDSEGTIVILEHKSRQEYLVNKATGKVMVT